MSQNTAAYRFRFEFFKAGKNLSLSLSLRGMSGVSCLMFIFKMDTSVIRQAAILCQSRDTGGGHDGS